MVSKEERLVQLDRKKEEIKKFFEEYQTAIADLIADKGIGYHFMDDEGIVYQLVELEGRWVSFDKFGVERTRRPGEERGSMSMKKAKELGYVVS